MPRNTPAATLPAFTPVPRKCQRHDGWTPERQQLFIEALADYGSVRAAANSVGMTPESAYLLRRHPEGKTFRKAWQAALDLGMKRVEDVAMDRALNGVDVPVYSYGKLVGTRTVHNDRLLMFMLRNRAPERFAADGAKGLNALDKHRLAQEKKRWRKEWERDRARRSKRDKADTLASLKAKFDAMRHRREALMSPETRRLQEAYEASFARDRADPFHWQDADAYPAEPEDEAPPRPSARMRALLPGAAPRPPQDDGWEVLILEETDPFGEAARARMRREEEEGKD